VDVQSDPVAANRARLLALLGAIAGSVGVVGFVAVVGGIVVWLRFDALNLPADAVVASIPRTDLVVIGLATLIPFIVLGGIVVLLAYSFARDNLVPTRPSTNVRPAPGPGGATVSASREGAVWEARLAQLAQETRAALTVAEDAAKVGDKRSVEDQRGRIKTASEAMTAEFLPLVPEKRPDSEHPELFRLWVQVRQTQRMIDGALTQIEAALDQAKERRIRGHLTRILAVVGLAAVELVIALVVGPPSPVQLIGLFLIGVVLSAATVFVGLRSPGFAVFAVAIFVSVLLFGTATTLWRTYHTPKVQPTAILRSGRDQGLTGYFVAQTSDRVYMVRILGERKNSKFQHSFPRFVVVPRGNIVAMEVGPLETPESAYGTSYAALQELCAQKVLEESQQTATKAALAVNHCGQEH
jgi:hypothetical protein